MSHYDSSRFPARDARAEGSDLGRGFRAASGGHGEGGAQPAGCADSSRVRPGDARGQGWRIGLLGVPVLWERPRAAGWAPGGRASAKWLGSSTGIVPFSQGRREGAGVRAPSLLGGSSGLPKGARSWVPRGVEDEAPPSSRRERGAWTARASWERSRPRGRAAGAGGRPRGSARSRRRCADGAPWPEAL